MGLFWVIIVSAVVVHHEAVLGIVQKGSETYSRNHFMLIVRVAQIMDHSSIEHLLHFKSYLLPLEAL